MTDREKLEDLIYRAHHNASCVIGHDGSEDEAIEEEVRYLIAHGVTVRTMRKPLTVEELMEMPGSVWYENDTVIAPMMVSNQKSFSVLYLKDVVFGLYRSAGFNCFGSLELPVSDYGKTWRCWAEKPTAEERMAAEWET